MAQDTSPTAPGIGPALWLGLILCLALGAGILWFFNRSAPEVPPMSEEVFHFQPVEADSDLISSERTRLRGTKSFDTPAVEKLREMYRDVNRAQFSPPAIPKLQEMQKGLEFQAEEAVLDTDVGGFIAAGRPIFEACAEGLSALLGDIQSGKISMKDALRDPPAETYEAYRSHCGNVLPFLRQTELVTEEGKWANPKTGPEVFGVLSRYRWAHLIDLRARPMAQLTPAERELLVRWRIEDAEAYPMPKREKFLESARNEAPEYSAPLAAGRMAIEKGDWKEGLKHWEQACKASPDDEVLQAQCAWLRQRVATGKNPSAEPASAAAAENKH